MTADNDTPRPPSRRDAAEMMAAALAAAAAGSAAAAPAPADIDPQSGCRLPLPRRADLDPAAQAIYDQVADPKGVTLRGLRGPSGIHLHSPRLAVLLRPLNDYLRNRSGLTGRVREVAILCAARATDSQFEWAAHEAEAIKQGVPAAAVAAIRDRRPAAGLDPADALVIDLFRASFETRQVPAPLYAQAMAHFGAQQLVDLIVLMGYYVMTAGLLTAFDMQLDAGVKPPLPVP